MSCRQLLREGDLTREELRSMLPGSDSERRAFIEEQVQEQVNLTKEFTEAIQSGDADHIATVLDQLLAQQRERNERLADFIAESTKTD
jgi:iron uptake system EfeUOB component EfeO/EfeM